jgi:Flp pilus assembly protein TadD
MSMMPEGTPRVIHVFYCYAREDKAFRDQLDRHLSNLRRQKQITTWYDREISPGTDWEQEIDIHLSTAHLILLLVSPDFMDSDYCYGIEMKKALERHERGTARVVPIILRPVDWEDAPFSHLQVLPTDALPIASWRDRDEAFADVARYIRKTVKELQVKTKQEWLKEGIDLLRLNRYEEALTAFEQAIHLDPNYALAYIMKGWTLNNLKLYEEALAAYDQAIRLDPNYAVTYNNKGNALRNLKLYEKALIAYEQAIRLDPNYTAAYNNKGNALRNLKRYEEALTAYEQAIRLNPNYAEVYINKGIALDELNRYKEALSAYEQAIRLNPDYALAYINKGKVLEKLGKRREALQAYVRARELGYEG